MKAEKIIISFLAVFIGLLVAGVAFYLYQSTKVVPPSKTKTITIVPSTPTPTSDIFLAIDNPQDGEVTDKKTVSINGKTTIDATIIVSTESTDDVITPTKTGSFSTTVTIGDGANQLIITAISPSGYETKIIRTITYSKENF